MVKKMGWDDKWTLRAVDGKVYQNIEGCGGYDDEGTV